MPTLESYRLVEFSQGEVLSTNHKFKPDVQGGVCAALCNVWILKCWDGMGWTDTTALMKEFDVAVSKQRIWVDTFSQLKGSLATNYNGISHITRISMTASATGQFVDPLGTTFSTAVDGFYMLEFRFSKGGHMMGFFKSGSGLGFFDPNLGMFQAVGQAAVKDMAAQLWARYASWGFTMSAWIIWEITKAESARERMLKLLPSA